MCFLMVFYFAYLLSQVDYDDGDSDRPQPKRRHRLNDGSTSRSTSVTSSRGRSAAASVTSVRGRSPGASAISNRGRSNATSSAPQNNNRLKATDGIGTSFDRDDSPRESSKTPISVTVSVSSSSSRPSSRSDSSHSKTGQSVDSKRSQGGSIPKRYSALSEHDSSSQSSHTGTESGSTSSHSIPRAPRSPTPSRQATAAAAGVTRSASKTASNNRDRSHSTAASALSQGAEPREVRNRDRVTLQRVSVNRHSSDLYEMHEPLCDMPCEAYSRLCLLVLLLIQKWFCLFERRPISL